MEITEYQTTQSNSHGVYEFDWEDGYSVIHYGSWGVAEVAGTPKTGIEEKNSTSFTELPELIQRYAKEYLDLNAKRGENLE